MSSSTDVQPEEDARARLYAAYVSSGASGLRPETARDLAPRIPYLRRLVRDFFPADRQAAILDLGCGAGALLHVAGEQGYRNLSGVDLSAEQVEVAHAIGVRAVKQGDALLHLRGQASASVDLVITFDLIEHFTKAELVALVGEIHRVLKQGGQWLIHAPNGELPFFGRIRYGDFTHELAFTRGSLTALLKSSGFADVQCFEDRPASHGLRSLVRYALWRMLRGLLRVFIMVETGETGAACIFSQNLLAVARR